uniref:Uncharacterized protein n=1 Tax=Prolemur simus TaxID=1328070 RepID=A0A8C8YSV8_PROSS
MRTLPSTLPMCRQRASQVVLPPNYISQVFTSLQPYLQRSCKSSPWYLLPELLEHLLHQSNIQLMYSPFCSQNAFWFYFVLEPFLSVLVGIYRVLASPVPKLGFIRQKETPRNSLLCCSSGLEVPSNLPHISSFQSIHVFVLYIMSSVLSCI